MTLVQVMVLAVAVYVIGVPLLVWRRFRLRADPAIRDVAPEELPAVVGEVLGPLLAGPLREGFALQLLVEVEGPPPAKSYAVAISGTAMTAVEIIVTTDGRRTQTMVACCTAVQDPAGGVARAEYVTADTLIPPPPVEIPGLDYLRLPGLEFGQLLAVHEWRVAAAVQRSGGHPVHPDLDHEELRADLQRLPAAGQANGMLHPAVHGVHRLRLPAAFRWAWGHMWPISTVRRVLMRRRAAACLTELRAASAMRAA